MRRQRTGFVWIIMAADTQKTQNGQDWVDGGWVPQWSGSLGGRAGVVVVDTWRGQFFPGEELRLCLCAWAQDLEP